MFDKLMAVVIRFLLGVLFRVRVRGDLSALKSERLMIVANHQSFLDGLLIGLFLPARPVFVVHTGVLQNWLFRHALSKVEHLAVDPASPLAMRTVVRLLEAGRPVLIFPEGRITVTGSLMKIYDGPAFAAARSGATVVPVHIDGAAHSLFGRLPATEPRRLFPRITLTVQAPLTIPMPEAPTARVRRRKAGEAMRKVMQKMAFDARPSQTLYQAVLEGMELRGRGYRIIEDVRLGEVSYAMLLKVTLALSRILSRHTEKGEHVGVLMPNLASTVGLVVGLGATGRVPALLNFTSGTEGMQSACHAARVKTIVTSRAFLEQGRLEHAVAGLRDVTVLYLEDLRETLTLADKLWLALRALPFPASALPAGDPEAPAAVLFTSGSEGRPKGVVLSHRAILANVAQVRSVIDFSGADRFLNALPLFHSFGLTAGALLPVVTGTRVFLYPTPLHYRVIPEIVYDRNCTVLFGTSTFLGHYGRFAHPYDFRSLRYVVAGAEKLSDAVRQLWAEKFGLRILEGYGATECAPVLAVNTPLACKPGTVGELLPGLEARLLPVPGIDNGGMLHVRGPNLMSGYYRYENPGVIEPPASELGAGWYATGDIVEMEEERYVRIAGRLKRFAKVAGEMVSLELTERIATTASPTAQHGASAQTDAQRGEAIVLATTDAALSRERLLEAARGLGCPELAVPRKIIHLPALPLLGTGKVDYLSLKKLAEAA